MRKAALITGSARRVGRALAFHLAAKHGYDIVAHYNSSPDEAIDLQEVIRKLPGKECILVQADLRDFESLEKMMKYAFSSMPHLNTLVNNASVFYEDSLRECSHENFDENFGIHVKAPTFLTQYFARVCKKGKIINVADTNVTRAQTRYFSYLLSKKSLVDLTLLAASEFHPEHICVNAVCPTQIPAHEIDNIQSVENLGDKPQLKNFLEIVDLVIDFEQPISGKIYHMDK